MRRPGFEQRVAACLTAVALALVALAACVRSPVPHEALTMAETAVARARTAGAGRHAPVALMRAETKLQDAHAAIRAYAPERARTLAQQALVDAELAEAEAQAAQARATATHLRHRIGQQHLRVAPGGDDV